MFFFCAQSILVASQNKITWCHVDYFNNVFGTFLDLERDGILMESQRALGFHQNILICVLKTNKGFMGSEQHEGE